MSKRFLTNTFIAGFLALILVDGLPTTSLFHGRLKALVDPFLDKVGLWQQSWQLFAPTVEKTNARLSAVFTFEDGTQWEWHSPEWPERSLGEKFVGHREAEYFDAVRNDSNASAWPPLLRYLASGRDREPKHVKLTRHWNVTPPPQAGDRQPVMVRPMEGDYVILESAWADLDLWRHE